MNDRQEKTNTAKNFLTDPELAIFDEVQDISEVVKSIQDSLDEIKKKPVQYYLSKNDIAKIQEIVFSKIPTEKSIVEQISKKIVIPTPVKGTTPTKGQDYFTEEDKNEIVSELLEKIKTNIHPDFADDIRNKLELLHGDERLDAKYIKNIEKYAPQITQTQNSKGGYSGAANLFSLKQNGVQSGSDIRSINFVGANITNNNGNATVSTFGSYFSSKVITYNTDGTVNVFSDTFGTKTMTYSNGLLVNSIGTGIYKNKAFIYNGSNQLINVIVT